ncbi:hypothetical protein A134_23145 [Vibrio crassostreae 9CS106]|uniref:Curculin (Mannose-binding) lectin protein n=1 Tax=Vibrio crassostreae 9CS106 TaxID=1191300 RepID=A0A1B1C3D8_9VIBR|nr:hypothetical protein A134_23145 [Vibrio crassostreae 9CS106]
MPISKHDVKLLESERLTDEPDGGGRATGKAIVSGQLNNLFPDLSRLDRTVGDVSLRKVFCGVVTDNSEVYLGAHVIANKAPKDPHVHVVLFDTQSQTDEREQARQRIEAYTVKSVILPMQLYGNHLRGQKVLSVIQQIGMPAPETGNIHVLLDRKDGHEQFVRFVDVEGSTRDFIIVVGSERKVVKMDVYICELATELQYDFQGVVPSLGGTDPVEGNDSETIFYDTIVADAARYFGVKSLKLPLKAGDTVVNIGEVYTPLVPSTTRERGFTDESSAPPNPLQISSSSSPRNLSIKFGLVSGKISRSDFPHTLAKTSGTLVIDGGTYVDRGNGYFEWSSGSNNFESISVDYELGVIQAAGKSKAFTGNASLTYQPAVSLGFPQITERYYVTDNDRGFTYVFDLSEANPVQGSVYIQYVALGKWQTCWDDGKGTIVGAAVGTVDYVTGSINITFTAQPDARTYVLITAASYQLLNATLVDKKFTAEKGQLLTTSKAFLSERCEITWENGAKKAVGDNKGNLSGDATGKVYGSQRQIFIKPNVMPILEEEYLIKTDTLKGDPSSKVQQGKLDDKTMLIDLGGLVAKGTVTMEFTIREITGANDHLGDIGYTYKTYRVKATDDPIGGDTGSFGKYGTIDYTTGQITVNASFAYKYSVIEYRASGFWSRKRTYAVNAESGLGGDAQVLVNYVEGTPDIGDVGHEDTVPVKEVALTFDLTPSVSSEARVLQPNSLEFKVGSQTFIDDGGDLVTNYDTSTGTGDLVGSVDYESGYVTINEYGTSTDVQVVSGVIIDATANYDYAYFRCKDYPVKTGNFMIKGRTVGNNQINGRDDGAGKITGDGIKEGVIDYGTGLVDVKFTEAAAAETIRYNVVSQKTLPISSDLIGLDSSRLPADGRVPVFRDGNVVVLNHEKETEVENPVGGTELDLARTHIASVMVTGSKGLILDEAQYTVNLSEGKLRWADPLVLVDKDGKALAKPLTVTDRIEHMSLIENVQILGTIDLLKPIAHDFPADETTVSSAILYGDTFAVLSNWFGERSWDNANPNWSDKPVGDPPVADYDRVNFPPVVINKGSIDEKWVLLFKTSTNFDIIGKDFGVIGEGSIDTDTAPPNPANGSPFFTILAGGWGDGWVGGNAIRFNTRSALNPLWVCRTTLSSDVDIEVDEIGIQVRGDAS